MQSHDFGYNPETYLSVEENFMAEHLPQDVPTPSEVISHFSQIAIFTGPPPPPPTDGVTEISDQVAYRPGQAVADSEIRMVYETGTQQPKSRGSRTRQACDLCAKSRRKCDDLSPCGECAKRGKDCTYTRPQKRPSRTSLRSRSSGPSTNVGHNVPPLPEPFGFQSSLETNDPMDEDHVGIPASDLHHTPVIRSMRDNEDLLTTITEQLNVCQRMIGRMYRQLQLQSRSRQAQNRGTRSEQEEDKDNGQDSRDIPTSHTPNLPARRWRGLPKFMSRKVSSKKPRNSIFRSWGKSHRGADGEAS
ncbi:hypothetical protein BC938DRAFT_482855 [Jimgerdemannia flammicorona]|uniref:Zn(2)-C6 fungal-type domain-containing protein n=1 Tax=Jimgerdemannia flammicorona TaxID=994334 RepID=A0A433QW96_9FUNG|nr:hypothetical protein BC938DRAFT_482855 [Jimgerdemannia flammicorona]